MPSKQGETMVKVVVNGSITEVKEEGFVLRIHPDGEMYVSHQCSDGNDILIKSEMRKSKCINCGKFEMPAELRAVYTLYNFDSIQRGE